MSFKLFSRQNLINTSYIKFQGDPLFSLKIMIKKKVKVDN